MAATDTDTSTDSLGPLLEPASIAIIGASNDPTRIGGRPLRYTREAGFAGPIYPVNPNRDTVQGLPSFASIGEVPGPVDTAIIAVPAPAVVETTGACAAAGVKAVIIFSAGFAETGDNGRRHLNSSWVITPTADGAKGRAYWLVLDVSGAQPTPAVSGYYDDVFVKTPDGWKIKSRTLHRDRTP